MIPLLTLLPITKAKQQLLNWNDNTLKAFDNIKQAITNITLLSYPKPDAPTNIITGTSNTAVGALLQQLNDNTWKSIGFVSKKLKSLETK